MGAGVGTTIITARLSVTMCLIRPAGTIRITGNRQTITITGIAGGLTEATGGTTTETAGGGTTGILGGGTMVKVGTGLLRTRSTSLSAA